MELHGTDFDMVCTNTNNWPETLAAPYVNAVRVWAQGVEMQMAMTRCWMQLAMTMNPAFPEFDVHKLSRPHCAPSTPETPSSGTDTGEPDKTAPKKAS